MEKNNARTDEHCAGAWVTARCGGIGKHSKFDKSAVLAGGEP